MKITKKELVKTAKELNELMGLDPAIPTGKDVEEAVLIEKIGEAAEMLEEDDEISEVAQEVIDYIAELQEEEYPLDVPGAKEQPADEDDAEETTEQLVEKSDYKALKAMVAEYPEFKGIDIALYPAKKVEDLRVRMLKDYAKKSGKKAPATEAKEEKPAAKKDAAKKEAPAKKEAGEKKTKVDYSQFKKVKINKELDAVIEAYWKKNFGKKTDKGIAVVVPVCEKHPEWHIDQVYTIFTKCAKSVK